MQYKIEFLKADIRDELEKLKELEHEFSAISDKLKLSTEEITMYDKAAIGYYLHSFYNGCENIFRSIAKFFENDMDTETWHKDILNRMKLVVPGFRPAAIDEELFYLLDDFRGFRHKFRYSYGFELDWEKERNVAKKFKRTFLMFYKQMEAFLLKLNDIE